ncbi:MAG: LytTR family DNA-binding domain-containing protein [Bacteroidales bacterium]|jgi:two-component system LytT family response regulator|nr:LytTR family DNA-binding domain-containing protein [Bacteroidales bacterium]
MESQRPILTVIVDDEEKSLHSLKNMLLNCSLQLRVIGEAKSVAEAVKVIDEQRPDLVFLDISMPDGEGFDVIGLTGWKHYEVVFVTAYEHYALKAFEFAALHYLLKPVDEKDLLEALERFNRLAGKNLLREKWEVFQQSISNKPEKIILPTLEGFMVINIDDIMRCEAEGNYTTFYLSDSRKLLISKGLNNFETILHDVDFCRVHHKHLINLKYVSHYNKGKGGIVIMKDKSEADVSENRKKEFLERLKQYAHHLP